jgi:hypothetical protein
MNTHVAYGNRVDPINVSRVARETEQVWISGLGWLRRDSITCEACGDEGRIVTGWADDGDPENGPSIPYATEWKFCTCAAGLAAWREQTAEEARYAAFESYLNA